MGFQIETRGRVAIANSYYSVEFEGEPRDVELALATTTFKKERYIESNIALVKSEILGCDDDIASHFTMHVIDNGRTLDAAALSGGRVHVCPNANVGGAGGFAYGMIRAMEQAPRATHVLLMDDDVAVSPESIKRTYNLLRIVNDDYAEAMVSGAMLNMEVGEEQWEDTGYMTPEGTFASTSSRTSSSTRRTASTSGCATSARTTPPGGTAASPSRSSRRTAFRSRCSCAATTPSTACAARPST